MIQMLLLVVFFLLITSHISNSPIRLILSTIFSMLFVAEIVSFYMLGRPIDPVVLHHVRLDSLQVALNQYLHQVFFILLIFFITTFILFKINNIQSKIKNYIKKFIIKNNKQFNSTTNRGILSKIRISSKLMVILVILITLSPSDRTFGSLFKAIKGSLPYSFTIYKTSVNDVLIKYNIDPKKLKERDKIISTPMTGGGKNVIIILLESMETGFFDKELFGDLLPNLSRLQKEWTYVDNVLEPGYLSFGARYAIMTGMPFSSVVTHNMMASTVSNTNMPGLGDVFNSAGYKQIALLGAPTFSFTDKFFQMYHYDVFGYKDDFNYNTNARFNGWGVYDTDLFDLAKRKYDELLAENRPFVMQIMTLDAHHPAGHYDDRFPLINNNAIETAVHMYDFLIDGFIEYIKSKGDYENTVIFILPDHKAYGHTVEHKLQKTDRRLFMLTNAPLEDLQIDINEPLPMMHMPKMVTSAAKIQTNSIFLGDLFYSKDRKVMTVEEDDINSINHALWRSPAFIDMKIYISKIDDQLFLFDDTGVKLELPRAPVMVQLKDDLSVTAVSIHKSEEDVKQITVFNDLVGFYAHLGDGKSFGRLFTPDEHGVITIDYSEAIKSKNISTTDGVNIEDLNKEQIFAYLAKLPNWGDSEKSHIWSVEKNVNIPILLKNRTNKGVRVNLEISAYLNNILKTQSAIFKIEDTILETVSFDMSKQNATVSLDIPKELIKDNSFNIQIQLSEDLSSPSAVGYNDPRTLGISLQNITIEYL